MLHYMNLFFYQQENVKKLFIFLILSKILENQQIHSFHQNENHIFFCFAKVLKQLFLILILKNYLMKDQHAVKFYF